MGCLQRIRENEEDMKRMRKSGVELESSCDFEDWLLMQYQEQQDADDFINDEQLAGVG